MAFPFDTDLDTTAAKFVTTHTIPFSEFGYRFIFQWSTYYFTAAVPGVPF